VSVVAWSGRLPVFDGRLFSVSRVGHEKSKQSTHQKGNVSPGQDISLPMRLHRWMMMGTRFCRVSGVAVILTAVTRNMLLGSNERKAK
jgi:hypothetical protein